MLLHARVQRSLSPKEAPFLPLAFRLAASFGLLVLHLCLPQDAVPREGEDLYVCLLAAFTLEATWEASRAVRRQGHPFDIPPLGWIRANLLLDAVLLNCFIAFQGVDQERLATLYILPVLASAFYLRIPEIVAVGVLSAGLHVASVLLFTSGVMPPFGRSGPALDLPPGDQTFILGFASFQIFAATLVVVLIRRHLESLKLNLSKSEAVVDEISAVYRRVFESMFSGLITTDLAGRITSANPAAEAILQRRLPVGMAIDDLAISDLPDLEDTLRERRFERAIDVDGERRRIIGGNVAPLRDGEGSRTGHLILFQDLTDLKALEERSRVSERLATLGELSSEMAHELRNPMASILGCVQILNQGEHPRAMMDRVLTILRRESERVSAIVSDFLEFARPRPVRIQPLPFPGVVDDLRMSWEADPRRGDVILEADPAPDRWILGDPVCVHQIFTNLLSNARKAVRGVPSPRIRLTFQERPGSIQVRVADNGCGMGPEQLKAIFVPFSSGFEEGTGLGMSLVYQFVQQMAWDIRVESEPGRGTTVTLVLPGHEGPPPGKDA